jgi:steroid delta-isomerase-like uncharacterized protein
VTTDEAAVARYWQEVWTAGRFEAAAAFYAPTYRENRTSTTPKDFIDGATAWAAHFSDLRVDIDELFSVGHRVVSRVTYRGVHSADFKRVPAQRRSFEVTGIDIFEFETGRVVQHWHETDHLDLFRQLGAELAPAP